MFYLASYSTIMELIREVWMPENAARTSNFTSCHAIGWGRASCNCRAPAVAPQPQAQAAHTGCRYIRGGYAAGAREFFHKLSEADGLPDRCRGHCGGPPTPGTLQPFWLC